MARLWIPLLSLTLLGCPVPSPSSSTQPTGQTGQTGSTGSPSGATFRIVQSGKTLDLPSGGTVTVSYKNDSGLKYFFDGDANQTVSNLTLVAKTGGGQQLASVSLDINRDSQKLFKEIKGKSWSPNTSANMTIDLDAYKAQGKDVSGLFPIDAKGVTLPVTLDSGASPFKGKVTYQITTFEFDIPDSAISK